MRRSFLLAAAGMMLSGRAIAQSFTDAQRAEIVDILRDALRRDPSILRDALGALQSAEERVRALAASRSLERPSLARCCSALTRIFSRSLNRRSCSLSLI